MIEKLKRKTVVTGHFGSGKTEFSVSLAMLLAGTASANNAVALVDLDIVKPYFRSRERRELLESAGVSVYGSAYKEEITAELPALGATIRVPLEAPGTRVIVDLGGNDSGALAINQFSKYFDDDDETMTLAVVNANRPGTGTVEAVLEHISAIESVTGLQVSHIVSNTHMLRETTVSDIEKGHALCRQFCLTTGKELLCTCYPALLKDREALAGVIEGSLMPMGLYMRPTWL